MTVLDGDVVVDVYGPVLELVGLLHVDADVSL